MLKKNATILKALFLVLFTLLFLLIIGGKVKADGFSGLNNSFYKEDADVYIYRRNVLGIDSEGGDLSTFRRPGGEEVGSTLIGIFGNAKWQFTVTEKAGDNDRIGTVSIKFLELIPKGNNSMPTEVTVPRTVYFDSHENSIHYIFKYAVTGVTKNGFDGIDIDKLIFQDALRKENIKIGTVYLDKWAFMPSTGKEVKIKEIVLGDSIEQMERNPFNHNQGIEKITVSNSNALYASENGVLFDKDKTILYAYPTGKKDATYTIPNSVTRINYEAFYKASNLKKVIFGSNLVDIWHSAFRYSGLEEFEFNERLNIQSYAFGGTKIESAEIYKNFEDGTKGVFYGCTELDNVTIHNGVTKIPEDCFVDCSLLEKITLPSGLTIIGKDAFAETRLKNIEIPKTVTTIEAKAFKGCINLESIVVYSNLNSVASDIFDGCNTKKLVVYCTEGNTIIPSARTYITYEIDNDKVILKKFASKDQFETVNLLSMIYELPVTKIDDNAFKDFQYLNTIVIPKTVTTIGNSSFKNCTGLTEVFINKELTTIGDNAFEGCENAVIYIEKGSQIRSIGANAFKNVSKVFHDGSNEEINRYLSNNPGVNAAADNEGPEFNISYVPTTNKVDAKIKIIGIDDNGGSGAYKYVITQKELKDVTEDEWKLVPQGGNITETVTKNGTYYIYTIDRLGNIYTRTREVTGIDEELPVIGDHEVIGGKVATVKVTVTDGEGSGLAEYAMTTTSDVTKVNEWEPISGSLIQKEITTAGTIYLYVKDAAGNIASKTIEISETKIDNVKPKIRTIDPTASMSGNTIEYYNTEIFVEDSGIGLKDYAIDMNEETNEDTEWITIEKDGENYRSTYTINKKIYDNGTHYIHVRDAYENEATGSFSISDVEDTKAPEISIKRKDATTVTIKITDYGTGIDKGNDNDADIKYGWSSSATVEPTEYVQAVCTYEKGDKEIIIEVDASSQTGTRYLWVKPVTLKDVAGHTTAATAVPSEALDFEKPTLRLISSTPAATEEGIIPDDINKVECIIDAVNEAEEIRLKDATKIVISPNTITGTIEATPVNAEDLTQGYKITISNLEGKGTATITIQAGAFTDASGNENIQYAIENIKVDNIIPTGVTLSETSKSIEDGTEFQLIATVTPSDATNKNVTWTSSDESVAIVEVVNDATAKVTALKPGTTTITVTTVKGEKTATCEVTVTEVLVTGVELVNPPATIDGVTTQKLTAKITPANATNKKLNWESSNEAVATVDAEGNVTTLKDGQTTITVTAEGTQIKAECTITVNPVAATGITLSPKTLEYAEETYNLRLDDIIAVEITPSNATTRKIIWSSDNEAIANIHYLKDNSTLQYLDCLTLGTAIQPKATITARIEGTEISDTCEVTVIPKQLTSIGVTTLPTKTEYIEGQNFDPAGMIIAATYNNGNSIPLSNDDIVVIGGENLALGTTSVTISYTENETPRTVDIPITVVAKTLTSIDVTTLPTKTEYIEGQNFDPAGMVVTATYDNGKSLTVSNDNIVVIGGTGLTQTTNKVTISYTEGEVTLTKDIDITVTAPTTPFSITSTKYYIDNVNNIIIGINPLTTAEQFNGNIVVTGEGVTTILMGSISSSISSDNIIKTGDQLVIMQGGEQKASYTLIVKGDVSRDGKVGIADIVKIAKAIAGTPLSDIEKIAGDLTGDGKVGIADIVMIAKVIANIVNIEDVDVTGIQGIQALLDGAPTVVED